jgi:hypothetical protein
MISRPFNINLSIHREMYAGALRLVLMLLSVTFIGLLAWDLHHLQDVQAMTERGEQALVRAADQDRRMQVDGRAEGLDLSDAALQRLPRDVAFANQLITKRAFSWTHFLGDLEEAIAPGVSINSIRLDLKESIIALTGSAVSLKDLATLIIGLEDHPAFHDALLLQHRVQDNSLVDFNITVHYMDVAASRPPSAMPKKTN